MLFLLVACNINVAQSVSLDALQFCFEKCNELLSWMLTLYISNLSIHSCRCECSEKDVDVNLRDRFMKMRREYKPSGSGGRVSIEPSWQFCKQLRMSCSISHA